MPGPAAPPRERRVLPFPPYRACRRCCPTHAAGTPAEQAVEQARAYLDAHLDEQVPLQVLADEVGLSPYHLQRTFKRFVGLSPKQYQDVRRLEAFKEHVGEDRNVLEATFEAGFSSSRALYDQAEASLGMTPGTYRRGGEVLTIRFAALASVLGQVLVAVTERGVCAVSLGEEDMILVAELKDEFRTPQLLNATTRQCRHGRNPSSTISMGYMR